MKKMIFLSMMFFTGIMTYNETKAQVSVNINIGSQPVWGPVGYDHVDYYYMPDIDAYYYVPARQYIYTERGRWIYATALPSRFGNYDIYRGYKVVVNEPKPYLHADVYRSKYGKYKGWYGKQTIIRDSHDKKYYEVKNHPMNGKGNEKKYYKDYARDDHDHHDNGWHGNKH